MKTFNLSIALVILALIVPWHTNAQVLSNVDMVAPFNEALAAVKKGNSWGFIDTEGTLVIDYRSDIVVPPNGFPKFSYGLCLVQDTREGIVYYGYINTKGEKTILPEYLAATPFENGFGRVIKHYKQKLNGTNALGKNIISNSYNEFIINSLNETIQHLVGPINFSFDANVLKKKPIQIASEFISESLISVKEKDNKYTIYKLKE
jgi:hypothetical protein